MESFDKGHTFTTGHAIGAKILFKCNHWDLFIIFGVIVRI